MLIIIPVTTNQRQIETNGFRQVCSSLDLLQYVRYLNLFPRDLDLHRTSGCFVFFVFRLTIIYRFVATCHVDSCENTLMFVSCMLTKCEKKMLTPYQRLGETLLSVHIRTLHVNIYLEKILFIPLTEV